MFGGVEQLIRESQRWASRDQAQLANGFANWNAAANEMEQHSMVARSNGVLNRRDSHVGARQPVHWNDRIDGVSTGAAGDDSGASTGFGRLQQQDLSRLVDNNPVAPANNLATSNPGAGTIMQGDMTGMAEWLDAMSDLNSRATMYDEEDWYL
jgi:hypothetical protein